MPNSRTFGISGLRAFTREYTQTPISSASGLSVGRCAFIVGLGEAWRQGGPRIQNQRPEEPKPPTPRAESARSPSSHSTAS